MAGTGPFSTPYKAAKEAFVSDGVGTSVWDINKVSLTALTTYALWSVYHVRQVAIRRSERRGRRSASRSAAPPFSDLAVQFGTLVIPLLLGNTILASHPLLLNAFVLLLIGLVIVRWPLPSPPKTHQQRKGHRRHLSKDESDDEIRVSVDSLHRDDGDGGMVSSSSSGSLRSGGNGAPALVEPEGHGGITPTMSSPRRSRSPSVFIFREGEPNADPRKDDAYSGGTGAANATRVRVVPARFPAQPFLTVYRAHMMLMTVICILAVDFTVFPRGFAKCETWGTSLMDLGVGSFVFSLGIVSALPFLRYPRHLRPSIAVQLREDVQRSLSLFALGAVRVLMVKGTEYPEHVTEYGVHWNFFFTLGLLPIFATLLRPASQYMRFSTLGLIMGFMHQSLLSLTPLQDWVLDTTREGLIGQNKEGLVSFPGYLSLYLLALDLGHYVLPPDPYAAYRRPSRSRRRPKPDKLAMVLASFAVLWWTGFYCLTTLGGAAVSRRLANLSYTLWVTAFNTTFLLGYVLVYVALLRRTRDEDEDEAAQAATGRGGDGASTRGNERGATGGKGGSSAGDPRSPWILEAMNRNAFLVFLLANLMTGVVNVTMGTMYASQTMAMVVLSAYTLAVVGGACELARRGIRVRL